MVIIVLKAGNQQHNDRGVEREIGAREDMLNNQES